MGVGAGREQRGRPGTEGGRYMVMFLAPLLYSPSFSSVLHDLDGTGRVVGSTEERVRSFYLNFASSLPLQLISSGAKV